MEISFYFCVRFAAVTAFVGSFNVDINKILAVFQHLKCAFCLTFKVCVDVAGCTLYVGSFHTCADADTFEKVNCRNNCAVKIIK